jgi:hypothetical protein
LTWETAPGISAPGGGVLILDMEATGWGRLAAVVERLLGEPAGFRSATGLERHLATYGILGTSTRQRGRSHAFLGSIALQPGGQ